MLMVAFWFGKSNKSGRWAVFVKKGSVWAVLAFCAAQ